MVGGFSITPSVRFYPSFFTTIRQVSIIVTIVMLLSPAALARLASAGTDAGCIRKSIHARSRLGSEETLQLPKPVLQRAVTSATTRLHRHILLVSGGAAGGSLQNIEDQAMRALVGSSPPKCVKKCGACTPCKSVLVPIHTNNLPATPAEYYPEAWRCQCKGKLYNP